MASSTKMEFMVEMSCQGCADSVSKSLNGLDGIQSVTVNLDREQVIVETTLPSSRVKDLLESTGKRAVLQGMGKPHLGAAVAIMESGPIKGVTRMIQTDNDKCVIEGTLDGLTPGSHSLYVHKLGDLSSGCDSCGDIFNISGHQNLTPVGNIGRITAGKDGRANFRVENPQLKVWDVIGRSMVLHHGTNGDNRLACGIIARSAGLFQNSKKICACDGVALWDERDVPVAGPDRQKKDKNQSAL